MPMLANFRLIIDFRRVARVGWTVEVDIRGDELCRVLVGGRQKDGETRLRTEFGKCADDIVRLKAFRLHNRDVEGFRKLKGIRNARRQIFGHLLPRRFVGGIGFFAESRTLRVHCQNEVIGLFAAQNAEKSVREPKERGSIDARGGHTRIPQEHEVSLIKKGH